MFRLSPEPFVLPSLFLPARLLALLDSVRQWTGRKDALRAPRREARLVFFFFFLATSPQFPTQPWRPRSISLQLLPRTYYSLPRWHTGVVRSPPKSVIFFFSCKTFDQPNPRPRQPPKRPDHTSRFRSLSGYHALFLVVPFLPYHLTFPLVDLP